MNERRLRKKTESTCSTLLSTTWASYTLACIYLIIYLIDLHIHIHASYTLACIYLIIYLIDSQLYPRPSFTQPPARKMQKLEGSDKKKSKMSKQSMGDSKGGVDGDSSMKGRGEAPDRFWSSVEPYCADITDADIKFLEDTIASVSTFFS